MNFTLLSCESGLVGRDLDNALAHFRSSSVPLPTPMARFKKKEPLETLPKSILRHRMNTLTGRPSAEVEAEVGFSIKEGKTMTVDNARRLAHFLILESNGELGQLEIVATSPAGQRKRPMSQQQDESVTAKRPRGRKSLSGAVPPEVASPFPPRSTPRSTRRSLAPETIREATEEQPSTSMACRLTPARGRKTPAKKTVLEDLKEEEEEENEVELNPTPQMLEMQKKRKVSRRSIAVTGVNGSSSFTAAKATPVRDRGFPGSPLKESEEEASTERRCKIFLVSGDATTMDWKTVKGEIREFPGANLTLVHTPAEWQPPEVFNVVRRVRGINKELGLNSFLVLVRKKK